MHREKEGTSQFGHLSSTKRGCHPPLCPSRGPRSGVAGRAGGPARDALRNGARLTVASGHPSTPCRRPRCRRRCPSRYAVAGSAGRGDARSQLSERQRSTLQAAIHPPWSSLWQRRSASGVLQRISSCVQEPSGEKIKAGQAQARAGGEAGRRGRGHRASFMQDVPTHGSCRSGSGG